MDTGLWDRLCGTTRFRAVGLSLEGDERLILIRLLSCLGFHDTSHVHVRRTQDPNTVASV